jgi:hypothetical protein
MKTTNQSSQLNRQQSLDHFKVCVIEKKTGEVLSQHEINPGRSYWTNVLVDEETKRSRKAK